MAGKLLWFGRYLSMDADLRQFEFGRFNFIKLMAHRMAEHRGITNYGENLFEEAESNFYDFLNQSGITFGHPDFDWTPTGAFALADEYLSYDDVE